MTPLAYYHKQIETQQLENDEQQLAAITHFDSLYHELIKAHKTRKAWLSFLRQSSPLKGVYLWGGVGIGKTFLMDSFYQSLPFKEKKRMHFHQFMRWVHAELKRHQGIKNPLHHIAKELSQETHVLCFDELHVSDITDAMILGRLFDAIFSQGICLVTTSNAHPDDLYKNGLQRKSFLPAIALIKTHTTVMHIPTQTDYRLRNLNKAAVCFSSHDAHAEKSMEEIFTLLTPHQQVLTTPIDIDGRAIAVRKRGDDVIWFDFDTICKPPRSQHDYLALAEQYRTVIISNIPVIAPNAKNIISLFIKLIDILYDARVRFIYSSAAPAHELYPSGTLATDYQRAASRLIEMQSAHYHDIK